jgi:hypothetical protein
MQILAESPELRFGVVELHNSDRRLLATDDA